jgi:hypothetical protein
MAKRQGHLWMKKKAGARHTWHQRGIAQEKAATNIS